MNLLYFLEVKADGKSFSKIGITTRLIEEGIAAVQRDVRVHYSEVAINLLGLWEHRGNGELYFKHRYKVFNYRIEKLTEYFVFLNVKRTLRGLFEMEARVLSNVEQQAIGLCWVMLSWMCGFGVSAIVKQQPRRTPPPISNSTSGKCGALLNAPKRMGTLSFFACQEVPFSTKVFSFEALRTAFPSPSLLK
ncbi:MULTISPECIES: hypothetical protein [unclassified Microcoleus]|uniref:hypothetical protein n=1 Tax=unclassified Microcoleus TaxID=2642155 RepID=UPI002FD3F637